jgi:tetratricopeptide (TPR) repeat protein
MPKTQAVDASHGVLTDHSIPRVPKPSATAAATGDLTAFLGTADDRALGIAYAESGDKRAREYLLRATPSDWQVRLRLAALEPDAGKAAALYESVLREKPGETAALVNLGALYARAGRTKAAAALWERALAANPALEEAALNLSLIRPDREAAAVVRGYLELNPGSQAMRARLAEIEGRRQ